MSCPSRILVGISCPGCGMSRAIMAALHLHLKEAFYYHPLVITFPHIIYLLLKIMIGQITKNTIRLLVILVLLFVVTYFVRIYLKSDVLTFDFFNSFIYGFYHNIIN